MNRVVFSSASDEWPTPEATFEALNAEFSFVDDPCPLGGSVNGLTREWGSPCFVNPPYSDIATWMDKAAVEASAGKTVVMLVPARTDTRWWHKYAMRAAEIRFIKGRLKFGGAKTGAPFPSAVVVFRGALAAALVIAFAGLLIPAAPTPIDDSLPLGGVHSPARGTDPGKDAWAGPLWDV